MRKIFLLIAGICLAQMMLAQDVKLTGTPIGSPHHNYSASENNVPANVFDGNLQTCYASEGRSYTWVGLDLGQPYVITKLRWSPRNDGTGPKRTQLAVIEGANQADFMDAVPLYVTERACAVGQYDSTDVSCSKGFRYVRWVGPSDARCNLAELEFYGHAGAGNLSAMYRPTNLPCVLIHTVNAQEPVDKVNDIVSIVTILGPNGYCLTDSATTRLRGNASMTFPKKPYRIKFNSKQKPLDATAKAKKWTLINNYGDKTLMRNLLAFELSRQLGLPYTPYGRSVDVILNGEYKGCYQLCDQIEVAKGRVDLPSADGSYLIEVDAYADQEAPIAWFRSNGGNPVTIKYPDDDEITQVQHNDIQQLFNQMEGNKKNKLDLNTFLSHFLVGEISGNTDTYWSTYMTKQASDDHFYVGPVWDFDLAFENDNRTYPINNKSDYIYRSGGSCAGNMRTFVSSLINDATVNAQLKSIYAEARNHGLTPAHMTAFIDSLALELEASQRLNFMRWDILNSYVHMNPRTYGSYQGEVNNVKNYLTNRFTWFDKKMQYVPSTVEEITPAENVVEKRLINGQICIIKGDQIYDIMGRKVE